jgi:hypothetical protein
LLRRGDSRAVAEDIERGVDGEESRPSIVSMVPNLEVKDTEVELLQNTLGQGRTRRLNLPVAEAPEIRPTPIDEIGRKHQLFAMCFLTLFRYGTADWHEGRMRGMTLADWAEHMLRFYDGRFSTHSRFPFLVYHHETTR